MESLTQKIVRILISNAVSIAFFFLAVYFGNKFQPDIFQYWPYPASVFLAYVIFEDFRILTGRA